MPQSSVDDRNDRTVILIVGFCNARDVRSCLMALEAAAPEPQFDVFVCENGGAAAYEELAAAVAGLLRPCPDENGTSASAISPSDRLPEIRSFSMREGRSSARLARASFNLGYAGAINAMIDRLWRSSKWTGVWILNPDTKPEPRALAELAAYAGRNNKAMVGSTIVDDRTKRVQCRGGHRWLPYVGRATTLGRNDRIDAADDVAKIEDALDCVSGASMFVTREALERVGPMDERFFLYYEDFDWSLRARHLGLGYAADSVVLHVGGSTLGSAFASGAKRTRLAIYLEHRNRIHFTRKHYPLWLALVVMVSFAHALRYLLDLSWRDFETAAEGLVAGLRAEIGPPSWLSQGFVRHRPKMERMPHWRVKIGISAIYFGVFQVVGYVRRLFGFPAGDRLTILYYHRVPSDCIFEFRRQMDTLLSSAQVVPANFRGVLPKDAKKFVAITFDDAFVSVGENALKEIRSRGFPCTIFVPVGLMGERPNWEVEDVGATLDETIMTSERLTSIASGLVALGSHGYSHSNLRRLSDGSLQYEVEESRAGLERLINIPVTSIAPPYGGLDARVLRACREAKYQFVYSTIPENIDTASLDLLRGRVRVEPTDGPFEFFLKFNGAYAWTILVSHLRSVWSKANAVDRSRKEVR